MIIDDENKVVVPDFMADYIEKHYGDKEPSSWDKADLLRDWDNYISVADRKDVAEWVRNADNFLTFVIAVATDNYIIEQPKKYCWRKKKEHVAWFEYEKCRYLNKTPGGALRLADIREIDSWEVKFTEQEASELLKDDFDMFEKVEVD